MCARVSGCLDESPEVPLSRRVFGSEVLEAAVAPDHRDAHAEGPCGEQREQVRRGVVPAGLGRGVARSQELGDRQFGTCPGTQVDGVRDETAEGVELTAGRGVRREVQARRGDLVRAEGVGGVRGHGGQQVLVGVVGEPGGHPPAQFGRRPRIGRVDALRGQQSRGGAFEAVGERAEEGLAVPRHVVERVRLLRGRREDGVRSRTGPGVTGRGRGRRLGRLGRGLVGHRGRLGETVQLLAALLGGREAVPAGELVRPGPYPVVLRRGLLRRVPERVQLVAPGVEGVACRVPARGGVVEAPAGRCRGQQSRVQPLVGRGLRGTRGFEPQTGRLPQSPGGGCRVGQAVQGGVLFVPQEVRPAVVLGCGAVLVLGEGVDFGLCGGHGRVRGAVVPARVVPGLPQGGVRRIDVGPGEVDRARCRAGDPGGSVEGGLRGVEVRAQAG
ncbi:hypothetical protein APS67_005789 [Streptomyces sp. AVP053U2]|nr:hypothetical protein APS67_005789 [Streptomyces sp. AVP053U2]